MEWSIFNLFTPWKSNTFPSNNCNSQTTTRELLPKGSDWTQKSQAVGFVEPVVVNSDPKRKTSSSAVPISVHSQRPRDQRKCPSITSKFPTRKKGANSTSVWIKTSDTGMRSFSWVRWNMLLDVGFEAGELDAMFADLKLEEDNDKDDEVPEVVEESKTQIGEIWQLGRHRIMCGDARIPNTWRHSWTSKKPTWCLPIRPTTWIIKDMGKRPATRLPMTIWKARLSVNFSKSL